MFFSFSEEVSRGQETIMVFVRDMLSSRCLLHTQGNILYISKVVWYVNMEFKGYKFGNHLYVKVYGTTRLDEITKGVNMVRDEDPD